MYNLEDFNHMYIFICLWLKIPFENWNCGMHFYVFSGTAFFFVAWGLLVLCIVQKFCSHFLQVLCKQPQLNRATTFQPRARSKYFVDRTKFFSKLVWRKTLIYLYIECKIWKYNCWIECFYYILYAWKFSRRSKINFYVIKQMLKFQIYVILNCV